MSSSCQNLPHCSNTFGGESISQKRNVQYTFSNKRFSVEIMKVNSNVPHHINAHIRFIIVPREALWFKLFENLRTHISARVAHCVAPFCHSTTYVENTQLQLVHWAEKTNKRKNTCFVWHFLSKFECTYNNLTTLSLSSWFYYLLGPF